MRIAQISPLFESVPPRHYGGTERVVSFLTEELVQRGHEVTLFASGDSVTSATLVSTCPRSLRLHASGDTLAPHLLMLERVHQASKDFDIIHFHVDYIHFPVSRRLSCRHVSTLHGRLDIPEVLPLYREFKEMPLVSISDSQRDPLPTNRWLATVHHGLPENHFQLDPRGGRYLAFLGRISPEKGLDRALDIAHRAGMLLRVAAKVDPDDRAYYETIAPRLDDPLVEYLGEIGDHEKQELLGGAAALLFPIDWPEPFGLVMIESLACGTPVVGWRRGSVPEIIQDGVNGFVVDDVDAAVGAISRIDTIDRRRCRESFERGFSAPRMAEGYLAVYARLLQEGAVPALVA